MRNTHKKYLIIFNTLSGGTKIKNQDVTIRQFCDWNNIEYEFIFIEKDGKNIEEYEIQKIQKKFPFTHILVSGGDGTVRRVIHEMLRHQIDVPVGILPGGSANVYCHFLGLSTSFEKNLKTFQLSRTRSMPVGRVNDQIFLLGVFFGHIAQITLEAEKNFKDVLGIWAYIIAGIRYSLHFPSQKFYYTLDQKNRVLYEGHSSFILLNSVSERFFHLLEENQAPFHFFAAQNKDLIELGEILYKNFILKKKSPHLELKPAQKIHIKGDFGGRIHIDGDRPQKIENEFIFSSEPKNINFLC